MRKLAPILFVALFSVSFSQAQAPPPAPVAARSPAGLVADPCPAAIQLPPAPPGGADRMLVPGRSMPPRCSKVPIVLTSKHFSKRSRNAPPTIGPIYAAMPRRMPICGLRQE